MSKPLVSVIIVVYNAVATLEKAIASVLDQTHPDIELVIVDGGSKDGTPDIIRKNISHQAAFYHRKTFEKIGDFNTKYRAYADWDFNIRCFLDPAIRTKYRDRIVAIFGMDGISRVYDRVFLKEVLIPAKLKM